MGDIFISYSRADKRRVDKLASRLKKCGLSLWIDRERVVPGEEWDSAIPTAISESKVFVSDASYLSSGACHLQLSRT